MTTTAVETSESSRDIASSWRLVGIVLLCVRFVQGWIYWGGGSRRFIYAPSKLDPSNHTWMANKFQTAMPGALLGMDHVISYLLQHFSLLYASMVIVSAVELIAGLFLMAGFLTRISALASIGLSVSLMLMFGWQGATCIDEWTMAAANFGMGAALLIGGAGAYSVDSWLLKKPGISNSCWFKWIGSGALPEKIIEPFGKVLLAITVVFVVLTYSYYRGSVIGPFHGGPTSPTKHHVSLDNVTLRGDGAVSFHAYLDAGSPDVPAHIIKIVLHAADKTPVETWTGAQLAALDKGDFVNDYAYNQFKPGLVSIQAEVGAKATISLPAVNQNMVIQPGSYTLEAVTIDGKKSTAPVVLN